MGRRIACLILLALVLALSCAGFDLVSPSTRRVSASSAGPDAATWTGTYHLSGASFAPEIDSILPNADGSLMLVGYDWTDQFADSFVLPLSIKLDSAGNVEWYQQLPPNQSVLDLTGSFTQVIPGNDGGYIFSANTSKVNPAQMDGDRLGRILKVDETGALVWQKVYQSREDVQGITPTANQSGYIAALGNGTAGGLMRIDNSGSVVWRRLLNNTSQILALVPAEGGSFIAAGLASTWQTTGSVWLGQVTDAGAVAWQETVHASPDGGRLFGLVRTTDGDFLAAKI